MSVLALLLLLLSVHPKPPADAATLDEAVAAYLAFDHSRAARLLEPLAFDGNAKAQRMLGYMYSNGQGVERNEVLASRWYCMSVRKGFSDSPACPWFVYLTRSQPEIVWQNLEWTDVERWRSYLGEARAGDAEAQIAVGLLYASGVGTERDLVEAAKWFAIAAEQRHPQAGALLERIEREMTREQIAEARRRALEWRPGNG